MQEEAEAAKEHARSAEAAFQQLQADQGTATSDLQVCGHSAPAVIVVLLGTACSEWCSACQSRSSSYLCAVHHAATISRFLSLQGAAGAPQEH